MCVKPNKCLQDMGGWLESAALEVVKKALGTFVRGIDASSFELDLGKGDVRLQSLELRTEALAALDLPVRVLGAHLGDVRVVVPWRSLGSQPMTVHADRVFLLLAPLDDTAPTDAAAELASLAAAKREQCDAWETVQDQRASGREQLGGSSVVDKLARGLLQKLQVRVTNLHVRLQAATDGGAAGACAAGLVLESFELADMAPSSGVNGMSAPSSLAAMLNRTVRKALRCHKLAAYLDPDARPAGDALALGAFAAPTTAEEWDTLMLPMIRGSGDASLLRPISGAVSVAVDPSRRIDPR